MTDKAMTLWVNGKPHSASRDPRVLLVDALRDELDLKASHVGCLSGDCGACSVLVDGEVRKSCLSLSVACEGRDIVTLEGDRSEIMQALQQAFIETNAFQCGFCTSGMLMAGADLLRRTPDPDIEQIRKAISGNLCRCTGYAPIIKAIQKAAETRRISI
jgi:carbon-monoxide dehydrogenase small subunit